MVIQPVSAETARLFMRLYFVSDPPPGLTWCLVKDCEYQRDRAGYAAWYQVTIGDRPIALAGRDSGKEPYVDSVL